MALTDYEWADRMAVPVTFIQAVGEPDAAAFMSALTLWRLPGAVDRDLWFRKVVTLRAPSFDRGGTRAPKDIGRASFFDALLGKCLTIYGGTGVNADPLALARHPWTLTADEFDDNYQSILKHKLPDAVPDDRARYGAVVTMYASVPAIAGALIGAKLIPALGAATTVASGAAAGGAALADHEKESAQERQRSQIRANYAGYAEIYRKEAIYRQKEAGPASAS